MLGFGDDFRFRNFAQEDMSEDGGFKDSWKWTLPIIAGGCAACLAGGVYLALFGAFNDHVDTRMKELLGAGGILAGIFMTGARWDGHSRRRAVVTVETTRIQAQRQADADDAADGPKR